MRKMLEDTLLWVVRFFARLIATIILILVLVVICLAVPVIGTEKAGFAIGMVAKTIIDRPL